MIGALLLATTMSLTPEARIEKFLGEIKAGRLTEARALLSADARRVIGEATIAAYVASRTRSLGRIVAFDKAVPAKEQFLAHVRFEKGSADAWFIVIDDGIQWFSLLVPEKTPVSLDEKEVVPVAKEMLALAEREGVTALSDLITDETLAEVGQERQAIRTTMDKLGEILGPLSSYELRAPSELKNGCREVGGTGTFRHGQAAVKLHVCWSDGIWSLRHALLTPDVTPSMVERMFAKLVDGAPKVTCPRDAPFPIGGEITCRVEAAGAKPQNARIQRTSESGWKVVGLAPVP